MLDLTSKKSRQKLDEGLHWQRISRRLSLGYRKGTRGSMWWAREFVGGAYRKESLCNTDDHTVADGVEYLNHAQALHRAIGWSSGPANVPVENLTIGEIVDAYMKHYTASSRDETLTQESMAKKWIKDDLRAIKMIDMKTLDLLTWRDNLTLEGGVSKATANRIWTVLRASLNFGFDKLNVPNPDRWRKVKPYKGVNKPKAEFLKPKEAINLTEQMQPDFKALCLAALFTGARYRELTLTRVRDVDIEMSQVTFTETKSGNDRDVPLNVEGARHFKKLIKDKRPGDFVFLRDNGDHWRKSQQFRLMRTASKAAKLDMPVNFHQFRHTYASALAKAGVPMRTIQELLGHSDMRITVQHYAHLTPDHVAEQVRQHLPSFTK